MSKNGNLLLNVGPRGEDAAIPERAAPRGSPGSAPGCARTATAVYGTRPWSRAEGTTREGAGVRFTAKDGALYALVLGTPPGTSLTIEDLAPPEGARVELLGRGPLAWKRDGTALRIELAAPLPPAPAHAFSISA